MKINIQKEGGVLMETELVKVKTINPHYSGYVRGFKFNHGFAEVPREDAEAMKEFNIQIVEPATKEVEKPKKAPRKKAGE